MVGLRGRALGPEGPGVWVSRWVRWKVVVFGAWVNLFRGQLTHPTGKGSRRWGRGAKVVVWALLTASFMAMSVSCSCAYVSLRSSVRVRILLIQVWLAVWLGCVPVLPVPKVGAWFLLPAAGGGVLLRPREGRNDPQEARQGRPLPHGVHRRVRRNVRHPGGAPPNALPLGGGWRWGGGAGRDSNRPHADSPMAHTACPADMLPHADRARANPDVSCFC